MPVKWVRRRPRRLCRKPYGWSTTRGSCRFVPGHHGPCKPRGPRW